jgi:hypothetical protein
MVNLVNKKSISLLFVLFLVLEVFSQQQFHQQKISLLITNLSLEETLFKLGNEANISFSYNAQLYPIDSLINVSYQNETLEIIIKDLLGENIELLSKGNHIIIRKHTLIKPEKIKCIISGTVHERRTNKPLSNTTIYLIDGVESATTDKNGYYQIERVTKNKYIEISYSSKDYINKIVVLKTEAHIENNIFLSPKNVSKIAPKQLIEISRKTNLDEIGIVKLLVSDALIIKTTDLHGYYEKRFAQASILPKIGTNKEVSGIVQNRLSFNLLAGYSGGINGVEIGAFLNVVKQDVKGVQIAGFGNITGEEVKGTQIAGFFNHNLDRVDGFQISGFSNTVLDTMYGVQIAGFSNVMTGEMKGVQMSGFSNVNTGVFSGWQFSGFSNVVTDSASGTQLTGFLNYGKHMEGNQIAGFANITTGNSKGLQLAGFSNITTGDLNGVQISGFINYAKKIKGVQFGLINIADTIDGFSFGLLNFIKKGYRKIDLFYNETSGYHLSFKSGTRKFYNILRCSFKEHSSFNLWSYGFGMGTSSYLIKNKLSTDINLTSSVCKLNNLSNSHFNLLNTLDLNLTLKVLGPLHFFVGPSFNYYISDKNMAPPTSEYIPNSKISKIGKYQSNSWVSYQIGIRL